MIFAYLQGIRVRLLRAEAFAAPHERDEVCISFIDDIVGIAARYVYYFQFISADMVFAYLVAANLTELYQTLAADYQEFFVLCMMPMFPFCNPRLGNVYRKLSPVTGTLDFREASTCFLVHFQRVAESSFGQIA